MIARVHLPGFVYRNLAAYVSLWICPSQSPPQTLHSCTWACALARAKHNIPNLLSMNVVRINFICTKRKGGGGGGGTHPCTDCVSIVISSESNSDHFVTTLWCTWCTHIISLPSLSMAFIHHTSACSATARDVLVLRFCLRYKAGLHSIPLPAVCVTCIHRAWARSSTLACMYHTSAWSVPSVAS